MLKRIWLFLVTNIAVIVLLNIVFMILEKVFWIQLVAYSSFLVIAIVIGFWGAITSLFLSKWSAKRAYNLMFITTENLADLTSKVWYCKFYCREK